MAEKDSESRFDEMERDNLQKVISQVEAAVAASTPASRSVLERVLQNAKSRVGFLDKKIKDSQTERENRSQNEQAAVAQMADREAKLDAEEKKTFCGFLKKDFFTKNDFGALEKFYAKSWDRLSDSGKEAMSHRVWEGVRRDEYTFTELPKTVREKETERAYLRLREPAVGSADESRISAKDREDFIRTYESGKHEAAGKILERDSFRESMNRERDGKTRSRTTMVGDHESELAPVIRSATATASAKAGAVSSPSSANRADLDISAINLEGLQLTESKEQGTSADMPNGKQGPTQQRITRGG